ncbi:MAG: flagellar motor switch protein FliG [Geminicoccaceae bacterium]
MSSLKDMDQISGPEKVAILMLTLSEEHVGKLFANLEIDEIKEISQIMSVLGSIDAALVEHLLRQFGESMANGGKLVGSFETTEKLLEKFLDQDRVGMIMEEIRGPAGRTIWDKLGNVNEAVLASYLKNEYPQTVAVVLSKIKPDHSSRVLIHLPEDFGMEVVMRMLRMETVQKDILADVEKTLRSEFVSTLARTQRRDNHEVMAEIFNYFDRTTETRFIGMLEERNKESADKIRNLMFTFDDLNKLDDAGVQVLMRNVGSDVLALALKGTGEKLREQFTKNMSERAAKILREDMDSLGPVRLRDVEEAQSTLVTIAKDLSANGEIMLSDGKEDELVY